MSSIASVIAFGEKTLSRANIAEARTESEFLVAAYLGLPRARIILDRFHKLSALQLSEIKKWLEKRKKRMPLAYVSGEQPFRTMTFEVSPDVLVPRPETELLVEKCLERLAENRGCAMIIDVGTGSGIIAISLAASGLAARVIAIDKSPEALEVAKRNALRLTPSVGIEWHTGDLLSGFIDVRADLIVANLPYVRSSEMNDLEPELGWEPVIALDGGHDGLRLIEPCCEQASACLKAGGYLLLEIGGDQADAVTAILHRQGHWTSVAVFKDLSGLPRIVQASRKG